MMNFYMVHLLFLKTNSLFINIIQAFGGTNWGYLLTPVVYSSYVLYFTQTTKIVQGNIQIDTTMVQE